MICYSIVAPRGVVTTFAAMHGPIVVDVVQDCYPKPQTGIIAKLDGDTFYVQVGDKRVPVSAQLVLSDAVERVDERSHQLRILRASASVNRKGDMELVPAQGDEDAVLLLIDVSSGYEGSLKLECKDGFQVVERGYQNPRAFQGEEEVLLASMHRGDTITAKRSSKKYIWFGQSSVNETLTFTLDPDLHCTLNTASAGVQRVF